MKTLKFKLILIFISYCGVLLIISGAQQENVIKVIIEVISGVLLVFAALKLAWITNNPEK